MSSQTASPVAKTTQYLQDVVKESRLISWPPFSQVVNKFFIVIILSSILTCLLYLIDIGLLTSINKLKEVALK